MGFQCINIRQVPWEVLKTEAEGRGFQHLPRDLANVDARKTMIDPYIGMALISSSVSSSGRLCTVIMAFHGPEVINHFSYSTQLSMTYFY